MIKRNIFTNIFNKIYFILKIRRDNNYNNLIIIKDKYENKLKKLNNNSIRVMSFKTFLKYIKNDNFIMKKYIFANDVKCLYGKNIYNTLRNYTLVNNNYEKNVNDLYKIILTYDRNNDKGLFYLTLFYQLLNGIHLFETINNINEMNTFIKENKELLDFNSTRNELITIYKNYYSNCL